MARPAAETANDDTFQKTVIPFLQAHCVKCHGPDKQSGHIRVDDLSSDTAKEPERWAAVRSQIRDSLMPPAKEPRRTM